jgi:anti-sigma factor RsiW
MTSEFPSHNINSGFSSSANGRAIDALQRDRFELLSAYLDGEVSAEERRQVEQWLLDDPSVQQLHTRLIALRQAFQAMPVPVSDQPVDHTIANVFEQVDRRSRFRWIWGGAVAAAAVALGVVVSSLSGDRGFVPQVAQSPQQPQTEQVRSNEPLLIALDKPLVTIPKAPVAEPIDSNQSDAPPDFAQ